MFSKKWPVLFGVMLSCLISSYVLCIYTGVFANSKLPVAIYGILGICFIIFLGLYNIRLKIYGFAMGSAHGWLVAHIYIGVFTVFVIIIHANCNISGLISIITFILFLVVVLSGIIGLLIYKSVPLSLSKYGRDVLSANEIKKRITKYQEELGTSITEMTTDSRKFYEKYLKSVFKAKRIKFRYLFMLETEIINRQTMKFGKDMNNLPEKEIYVMELFINHIVEIEKLRFVLAKTKLIRAWLNIHLPLTGAMVVFVIVHTISTVYF
ncbi:MAG: hypothetical protein ACUZ8H_02780 [Candidatus Anammoxibacter sp.]